MVGRIAIGTVVLLAALLIAPTARADNAQFPPPDWFRNVALAISGSYRTFDEALRAAERADAALPRHFPRYEHERAASIADAHLNERGELTYPPGVEGWGPRYVPRGRWGTDGVYVSIEHSSYMPGLTPGYFVVVVASGSFRDVWAAAQRATRAGVPTYVRTTRAFVGCIH